MARDSLPSLLLGDRPYNSWCISPRDLPAIVGCTWAWGLQAGVVLTPPELSGRVGIARNGKGDF